MQPTATVGITSLVSSSSAPATTTSSNPRLPSPPVTAAATGVPDQLQVSSRRARWSRATQSFALSRVPPVTALAPGARRAVAAARQGPRRAHPRAPPCPPRSSELSDSDLAGGYGDHARTVSPFPRTPIPLPCCARGARAKRMGVDHRAGGRGKPTKLRAARQGKARGRSTYAARSARVARSYHPSG